MSDDDTTPEPYTPTDEQVEAEWIASLSTPDPDNYWDAISEEEAQARWSRWLAAHDARVRRDAAREALDGLVTDLQDLHEVAMFSGIRANALFGANRAAIYRDTHYPEETP